MIFENFKLYFRAEIKFLNLKKIFFRNLKKVVCSQFSCQFISLILN